MPTLEKTPTSVGFTIRPTTGELLYFVTGEEMWDKAVGDIWTYLPGHQYGDALHLICTNKYASNNWQPIAYENIPANVKAILFLIL